MSMRMIDITKVISEEMTVYKNRESKKIKRNEVATYETTDMYESELTMNMHTGTHMDAPLHMVEGGDTVDLIDLNLYYGKVKVFDLTDVKNAIVKADLEKLDIQAGDRVIFKTTNSFDEGGYNPNFVYLEEDGAAYLRDKGIILLGMDAMSIERDKPDHPTHKIILGAGIGVLEDLDLKSVAQGTYHLSALPLRIKAAEATPVRAILIEE